MSEATIYEVLEEEQRHTAERLAPLGVSDDPWEQRRRFLEVRTVLESQWNHDDATFLEVLSRPRNWHGGERERPGRGWPTR